MTAPLRLLLIPTLALPLLAGPMSAADIPPGQVDFGHLARGDARRQVVEVNLDSNLISMVARLAASQEPEVATLLKGLRSVRVNVVGVDDSNRAAVAEQMTGIREQLDAGGWNRIVTVREPDQDVAIHLKARGDEAIEGVTVTVRNGSSEAVFINVVGDILPDQLAELGERFDIEPLRRAGRAARGTDTPTAPTAPNPDR